MRIRVDFWEGTNQLASSEVIIPDKPETPPGTGRWVWIGTVPATDVPITDQWFISLRPLRKDSVAARARVKQFRAPPPKRKAFVSTRFGCDKCSRIFGTESGRRIHRARMHEKSPSKGPGEKKAAERTFREPLRVKVSGDTAERNRVSAIAGLILQAFEDAKQEMVPDVALQIAGTVNRVFPKGVDRVDDKGLGREDRTDLYKLDGKLISHEVSGTGRWATHTWVLRVPTAPTAV